MALIFLIASHWVDPHPASGFEVSQLAQIGMAFLTNMAIHESGHFIMADSLGAEGNQLKFFTQQKGSFFLGLSTYNEMEEEGKLPYHLAGEFAVSQTFEYSLTRYRNNPTTYHNALLFFSATDFVFYSLYAFYLSPVQDDHYDPVSISKDTGLSQEIIFSVALTQALLNGLRVFSGEDRLVPYFTIDQKFASFNIQVHF
ncbi:MAG TPA: hypothetical protein VGB26_08120 [Nitrospiria bacterium]